MADNVTVSNSPTSINADIPVRTIDKAGEQVQVVVVDYGGGSAEDLSVPDFATEATLLNINSALSSGLEATINSDVLGVAVTGQRNNEIEISFFTSFNSDLITNTTASGGTATISGGHARYRTGTNATGAASGVSVYSCKYRPAHEQYAFFTAAFTAGEANSYQRIGLYNANNGFFIGYEGTSFGITLRTGSVDTTTARASWNGDPLDGSSGSKFTRGGTPEAINLAYSNLYRIRFAWLGSASISFEVFSPDGGWIVFHTIRIPNSQLNPSIQNPELPMTIDVKKTSGGGDLSVYTACWAAGTTSDVAPINETLNEYSLAKLTRAVITGETTAGGGGFVNVKVTPSGSLTISLGDLNGVAGQETMANSLPVVIASDQSAIPVTQSGTWNINNVSGTISLPTGAATSANQTTEITSLQLLDDVVATDGSVALTKLYQVGGTDGTNAQILSTNASGHLNIADGGNTITVDGTVAATQSGTWNITNITGTISLPTGAATETTLSSLNSKVTACNTGAVTISAALPAGTNNIGDVDVLTLPNVTLASQANPFTSAIPVSDNAGSLTVDGTVAATQSGTWNINNISGTISLPTGAATSAAQGNMITELSTISAAIVKCATTGLDAALVAGHDTSDARSLLVDSVGALAVQDNNGSLTVDGSVNVDKFPSHSTATLSNVTSAAVSTTILASNTNRKMAIFVNDANTAAYVKMGTSASSTSFSYKLSPGQTLELPIPMYTGILTALWDGSPTGSMRVTEIT